MCTSSLALESISEIDKEDKNFVELRIGDEKEIDRIEMLEIFEDFSIVPLLISWDEAQSIYQLVLEKRESAQNDLLSVRFHLFLISLLDSSYFFFKSRVLF